jgi:DNA-binding beta-propeller fold protein YncE
MEFGEPGVGPGQFRNPSGIAVAQAGDIYVADTDNDRVQRFSPRGVFLDQVGGFGRGDAQFNRPVGVAAGFGLEVYVADSRNRRVSIFTQGLRLAGIVGGEGAVRPALEFGFLGGVAVSRSGQVYVTDAEGNQAVRITHFDRVERGFGGIGYGGGELARPAGLAVAEDGKLYVADQGNDRVVAFDAFGGLIAALGEDILKSPAGVAVAPHGTVVVADAGHHRVVFFDGKRRQVIGEMGRAGDGPTAFDAPKGVAVDLDGYLYVLDSGNGRVQKFQMRWPE